MARKGLITKSFRFDGKRYYVYGKTEKEAIMKMAIMQKELEEGQIILNENTRLCDWWKQYLENYKTGCKEITLKNFKYKMEKRVIAPLGQMKLKDIKPIHCQSVLNSMQGMSADYIKKVRQGMTDLFEKARLNKLIHSNPCEALTTPTGTKTTRRSITAKEREWVLQTIESDPRFVFFAVMLYCGLRPSEVAGLQGMDLKDGLLHVRGTKTKSANRMVPIPQALATMLPNVGPFDYLFVNNAGKPHDEGSRNHLWKAFKRQLNITAGCRVYRNKLVPPYPIAEDLVPYCLRHTYCTDLQKAGVDIRTAQYLMGHSSITITANIYTHTDIDEIEKARRLIDSGTFGGTNEYRH